MSLNLRNLLIALGIVAVIFGVFIYIYKQNVGADSAEFIKITVDQENIWANGQDYATLTVDLPCNKFGSGNEINLTTTLGTLTDTTLKANAQCRAITTLKSIEPGIATIIATSDNEAGMAQVNFLSAQ